jgi:hypothetical protein
MLRTAQRSAAHTPSEAFHALGFTCEGRTAARTERCTMLAMHFLNAARFKCCALYGRMAHVGRFLARLVVLGTAQCALLYNAAHCATQLTKKT